MPLRAAQIFLHTASLEDAAEAVGHALRRSRRPHEGEERTLVALQSGGWVSVVLDRPDARLAEELSRRFGRAIELLLDGGALALALRTWEGGAQAGEERDPQPPAFRDVEAVAWELLSYLGIPASLRLLPLDEVEVLEPDTADGLPAVLVRAGPEQVDLWTMIAVPPPRAESEEPPSAPDAIVQSLADEVRALEVRVLPEGAPDAEWASSLAAVEEAQCRRLFPRLAADADGPRIPQPTFAYRSGHAQRLEGLLHAARGERPWLRSLLTETPLSHAGFTARATEALSAAGLTVARAHALHVEIADGAAWVRAPAKEAFARYAATLDAEAAIAWLVDAASMRLGAAGPETWPRERFVQGLLPMLASAGDTPAWPLVDGISGALLCDDGERIVRVTGEALSAHGLDAEAALDQALRNADERLLAAPEAVQFFDVDQGRVISCSFDDPAAAGRLLSAATRETLLRVLGEERCAAATPTRDSLLACSLDDEDAIAWITSEAQRRFDEGPYPIAPRLWILEPDGITPVASSASDESTGTT